MDSESTTKPISPRRQNEFGNADFSYWARLAYWDSGEFSALLLGVHPGHLTAAMQSKTLQLHPVYLHYTRQKILVDRAIEFGQLAQRIHPPDGLAWARQFQLSFPSALEKCVRAFYPIVDWKSECRSAQGLLLKQAEKNQSLSKQLSELKFAPILIPKEQSDGPSSCTGPSNTNPSAANDNSDTEIRPKRKTSYLKLIAAIVKDSYGHDPNAVKSPTSKDIVDHAASYGVEIHVDTVRSILKEAFDLVGDIQLED